MNHVFNKLANDAWIDAPEGQGYSGKIFSKEKFAELIVKECVSVCESEGYRLSIDTTTQYHRNLAKQCHKICAMLEQHFGVLE